MISHWWLTRGDTESAWYRCLPIWYKDGGINDLRGIIGMPFYSPSRGRRLARSFATRHAYNAQLILSYTQSLDPVAVVCAIDLLFEMAVEVPEILPQLAASTLPLHELAQQILLVDVDFIAQSEGQSTPQSLPTVGAYFRWQVEPGMQDCSH
jgi:hypothetical protein